MQAQPATAPTPTPLPTRPGATVAQVYEALQAQRNELGNQLDRLEEKRNDLTRELANTTGPNSDIDRTGLQQRIAEVDKRISAVDQQIAQSDQLVAQAAAAPGAVVEHPPERRPGPPDEVYGLGALFMVIAILPISIAYARRVWRRSAKIVSAIPAEFLERFSRLEQSVESIAIEVERVGEGQRFMTKVLAEHPEGRAIGAGAAQPVEVRAKEGVREQR
jgi:hypothetical protein